MRKNHLLYLAGLFFLLVTACNQQVQKERAPVEYALVIHGGAGNINRNMLSPADTQAYYSKMGEALDTGLKDLASGASSVEVVEKVVSIMEDSPLFNAGKGAVFNHEGINELDASIMEGAGKNAGAVAGVRTVKNPIKAARKVMEVSEHVFLSGEGADRFAAEQGLEIVPPSYFYTDKAYNSLQKALEKEKFGTVGCVALDKNGLICAGTSTGGRTNKKYGRIGDAPVIGAGTYASNEGCGVSATGHGEYFIRFTVAREISALMEYKDLDAQVAASHMIHKVLKPAGGEGGVVCLDPEGRYAMEFNTLAMFRAYANSKGERVIAIW